MTESQEVDLMGSIVHKSGHHLAALKPSKLPFRFGFTGWQSEM